MISRCFRHRHESLSGRPNLPPQEAPSVARPRRCPNLVLFRSRIDSPPGFAPVADHGPRGRLPCLPEFGCRFESWLEGTLRQNGSHGGRSLDRDTGLYERSRERALAPRVLSPAVVSRLWAATTHTHGCVASKAQQSCMDGMCMHVRTRW